MTAQFLGLPHLRRDADGRLTPKPPAGDLIDSPPFPSAARVELGKPVQRGNLHHAMTTIRDKRACKRWEPFLAGVVKDDSRERALKGDAYTNNLATVWDGWDRELIYVSPPPHQSYLLFSRGPDGKYNVSNPADRNIPDNKDNIYGDVGYVQH